MIRVVDGDTADVVVDLGFQISIEMRVRLAGIDAPELNARGPEGEQARDHLASLLPAGSICYVKTEKPRDKYGRWLAWIRPEGQSLTVNDRMVAGGFAVTYDGGTR